MLKVKRLVILLILCSTAFSVKAQKTTASIDVNHYVEIHKVYEQVVKEGYGTPFIYKTLANFYYFNSNYLRAKLWFEKLFAEEKPDAHLKLRYLQSLKALELDKALLAINNIKNI